MMLSLACFKIYGVQGKFDEDIVSFNENSSNAESLFRLSLNAQGESSVTFPKTLVSKAG